MRSAKAGFNGGTSRATRRSRRYLECERAHLGIGRIAWFLEQENKSSGSRCLVASHKPHFCRQPREFEDSIARNQHNIRLVQATDEKSEFVEILACANGELRWPVLFRRISCWWGWRGTTGPAKAAVFLSASPPLLTYCNQLNSLIEADRVEKTPAKDTTLLTEMS